MLSKNHLALIIALFLAITGNITFFQHTMKIYPWAENSGFLLSMGLGLTCVFFLLISLMRLILPIKWLLYSLLVFAAVIGHFQDEYGAVISISMIQNTLETNTAEATDLLTPDLLIRLALLGLLPSLVVARLTLRRQHRLLEVGHTLAYTIALLLTSLACMLPFSDTYASFFRNHKELRYYTNPTFPIYSAILYTSDHFGTGKARAFTRAATYARQKKVKRPPKLMIFVVGETGRADHFGINGYIRNTTPELSQVNMLISFTQARSCGTTTAISVPCMFAFAGRKSFDNDTAKHTENVLDILSMAGISVLWRDNNSSSKGVADRITYQDFKDQSLNPECDSECRDTGMLSGLEVYLAQQPGDVLIVLHQMGSHGPAYYKRYPKTFEYFTPTCTSAELSKCDVPSIINAYDNTIRYTDHFLSMVIGWLKAQDGKYDTAMFYMSDHGESLGENGLYLHGMPYLFAPETQTHIPAMLWLGENTNLDYLAIKANREQPTSHDAIVSTLLDFFDLETDATQKWPQPPSLLVIKGQE